MSEPDAKRQQLLARLSRGLVYTTPLLVAVTGAAGMHAIISDLRADQVPSASQSANPDSSSTAAPEATPEATPEAAPEATPEATPEAMPEATPEAPSSNN